jgi:HSP20 family protein
MTDRRLLTDLAHIMPGFLTAEYSYNNYGYSYIPVDLVEEGKSIYVYAEIPGVQKEDIELDFFNNQLTIAVDKTRNHEMGVLSEIKYGRFTRVVTLPICVTRRETVSTTYTNGVLKIRINRLLEEENRFSMRPE